MQTVEMNFFALFGALETEESVALDKVQLHCTLSSSTNYAN
jgi:hypothetical protein